MTEKRTFKIYATSLAGAYEEEEESAMQLKEWTKGPRLINENTTFLAINKRDFINGQVWLDNQSDEVLTVTLDDAMRVASVMPVSGLVIQESFDFNLKAEELTVSLWQKPKSDIIIDTNGTLVKGMYMTYNSNTPVVVSSKRGFKIVADKVQPGDTVIVKHHRYYPESSTSGQGPTPFWLGFFKSDQEAFISLAADSMLY